MHLVLLGKASFKPGNDRALWTQTLATGKNTLCNVYVWIQHQQIGMFCESSNTRSCNSARTRLRNVVESSLLRMGQHLRTRHHGHVVESFSGTVAPQWNAPSHRFGARFLPGSTRQIPFNNFHVCNACKEFLLDPMSHSPSFPIPSEFGGIARTTLVMWKASNLQPAPGCWSSSPFPGSYRCQDATSPCTIGALLGWDDGGTLRDSERGLRGILFWNFGIAEKWYSWVLQMSEFVSGLLMKPVPLWHTLAVLSSSKDRIHDQQW